MSQPVDSKPFYDWAKVIKNKLPVKEVFFLSGATNIILGVSFVAFGYYTLQYNAYRWMACGALLGMCSTIPSIKVLSQALRKPNEPQGSTRDKLENATAIYRDTAIEKAYHKGKMAVAKEMGKLLPGMIVLLGGGLLAHKYGHLHAYISKTSQFLGAGLLGISLCRAATYPIFKKLANERASS
jgi:hypothetical protein